MAGPTSSTRFVVHVEAYSRSPQQYADCLSECRDALILAGNTMAPESEGVKLFVRVEELDGVKKAP